MSVPPRTFVVPEDPAERAWRRRRAARVIVVDGQDRILLFCDTDPGVPGVRWWVTPGGGIDAGETERQAAVRELAEETGLVITEAELVGPIARREVTHGFSDQVLAQQETFYLIRVEAFEPDNSSFTEEEKLTLVENRWWTPEELATTDEWIWPKELLGLIDHAGTPAAAPLDLGLVTDESTVPV
ncbi:NUDIX hydrolase [Microlunatus sp. Gsoil 973]|uniref:NUDIX hydrolase n=1 Tax=Microlunatus sp. Gsoil 973 TaxID=2672569 RepID=UPI001E300AFE|nr:NUDIX domain-containing protein [Microlunatus sp. Gsoil 973]